MDNKNECEGCVIYNTEKGLSCPLIEYNEHINCPCRKCLIKVMCTTSCDEFIEYRKRSLKKGKET